MEVSLCTKKNSTETAGALSNDTVTSPTDTVSNNILPQKMKMSIVFLKIIQNIP